MATITIRNLDEKVKRKLQVRAAQNGRSMEAEARELLARQLEGPVQDDSRRDNLYTAIRRRVEKFGGVDLEIPARGFSTRKIPTFD